MPQEKKPGKLVPFPRFLRRVALSLALAALAVAVALSIGILGYHNIAGLGWIDSVMNASMILTGMGPVAPMPTSAAKLFASGYALFAGVVFLSAVGLVLAPIFHRILHRIHMDESD